MTTGTVVRVRGGRYQVAVDDGSLVEASLRGRVKAEERTGDRVVIGDRVQVAGEGDDGLTIEEVVPRRTQLVRRGARRPKVLAANLDQLLVVVAAADPEARSDLIDRLLVVGESSRLPCVLVINKVDLPGAAERAAEWAELYRLVGYPVLRTSVRSRQGLDELGERVCGSTSALMGPSGAGKSSLLNALDPELALRIGDVSWKTRRGRHTTTTSRLISLDCGGRVADTPGIGDVGLWDVDPADLDELFPEFRPLRGSCRFRGCRHVHEPDCAVLAAVEQETVHPARYRSYLTLLDESS